MQWNQVNASEAFKISFPKWFNSDTWFSQADCNLEKNFRWIVLICWMNEKFICWMTGIPHNVSFPFPLSLCPFCDLCFVYIFTSFDRWWEAITQRCFMNVVWDFIFPCAASSPNYKWNSVRFSNKNDFCHRPSPIAHRTQSNYWPEYNGSLELICAGHCWQLNTQSH